MSTSDKTIAMLISVLKLYWCMYKPVQKLDTEYPLLEQCAYVRRNLNTAWIKWRVGEKKMEYHKRHESEIILTFYFQSRSLFRSRVVISFAAFSRKREQQGSPLCATESFVRRNANPKPIFPRSNIYYEKSYGPEGVEGAWISSWKLAIQERWQSYKILWC